MYKLGIILLITTLLTGCAGTIRSRCADDGSAIGGYPYESIAADAVIIKNMGSDAGLCGVEPLPIGWLFSLGGLISIPLDLAIDTVMLPVDAVAWMCGKKKGHWK